MTEQQEKIKSIFEIGGKYTIYRLNGFAMTSKTEIIVKEIEDNKIIFSYARKRKRYILPFTSKSYLTAPVLPFEGAIFKGWNQPIKCDSEIGSIMRGNACYNFYGTTEDIKEWIKTSQLNPYFDKIRVLSLNSEIRSDQGNETVVFAEDYKGGHAIIDRILMTSQNS